jgi:hypothetical protein
MIRPVPRAKLQKKKQHKKRGKIRLIVSVTNTVRVLISASYFFLSDNLSAISQRKFVARVQCPSLLRLAQKRCPPRQTLSSPLIEGVSPPAPDGLLKPTHGRPRANFSASEGRWASPHRHRLLSSSSSSLLLLFSLTFSFHRNQHTRSRQHPSQTNCGSVSSARQHCSASAAPHLVPVAIRCCIFDLCTTLHLHSWTVNPCFAPDPQCWDRQHHRISRC